jgi:hypothetical protein
MIFELRIQGAAAQCRDNFRFLFTIGSFHELNLSS